jgi:hypothetical protein
VNCRERPENKGKGQGKRTLTEDQIRAIVGRVRAGCDLTPKTWPNGARVAVGLSSISTGVWFATHEEIAKYVKLK